jgi:hypothetical protein
MSSIRDRAFAIAELVRQNRVIAAKQKPPIGRGGRMGSEMSDYDLVLRSDAIAAVEQMCGFAHTLVGALVDRMRHIPARYTMSPEVRKAVGELPLDEPELHTLLGREKGHIAHRLWILLAWAREVAKP